MERTDRWHRCECGESGLPFPRGLPIVARLSEWSNVYQELFNEDPQCQKHALNRIAIWRCRVTMRLVFDLSNSVPQRLATAIDCTSQLVCAQLQETRARSEGALQSRDQELCMGYAMVLVRFVNLLTEKRQTKFYPLPVHAIAEELGLPQWLVELRHDITHSTFPSLSVLRQATHQALQWLKQEYWEVQQRALVQDVSELTGQRGSAVVSVSDLLQNWVNQQTQVSFICHKYFQISTTTFS
ncbi:hypothetical protein NP493_187g00012 [Ridgeia piscesae]|uniref:LAS1-like protein n=1 Tax=Ridgeia piscesae TaxID=27915 RepID=A0AAD9UET3_RIDPI|nr:hypothetical protein NP493_187g00012 [Ridgeia piscesae]